MVISAERPSPPADPPAPPPPRLSHIRDFRFPILKTWGSQRLLRFAAVNAKGEPIADCRRAIPPLEEEDGNRDVEEVREKLMTSLREAAGGIEISVDSAGRGEPEAATPWSLRPRRSAPRVLAPARTGGLYLALSKEEIAEDFYAVTGSLPRRRPRKRARAVQKQIDALFPGGWLSDITVDAYKVQVRDRA